MKVANRKCIRRLGVRALLGGRTRNLVAVLAIALTAMLFTSLFTIALSINDGFQQSNFRQAGGFSHGGFKYLTKEQFEELKEDPLIREWGLRRFLGMPTEVPFNKSHVEIGYSDAKEAHWQYCDPIEGRLPEEGTNEAATDTHVLELLGIEPRLGAEFTVTFQVDGKETTQSFVLCGWWEYDTAVVANHILVPESRVDEVLAQVGVTPPGDNDRTGSWNLDVMLKNGAWSIGEDLEQILENHGYQSESVSDDGTYVSIGVNWGYTGAQFSGQADPMTVFLIVGVLLLILLTGYLIIYNVFQISAAGDIRFYGLLKTIGTTPRQLRRIVRIQALTLSLCGIPLGLLLGWLLGGAVHRESAGRSGVHGFRQSADFCRFRCFCPVHRADLLLPARPHGGKGISCGGSALYRRRVHPEEGKTDGRSRTAEKRRIFAFHGMGQSGAEPGKNSGDRPVPVACGGAVYRDGAFHRKL